MSRKGSEDTSHVSLLELFRLEVENQTGLLTASLLELERNPGASAQLLETLMRAAHSLKGAARIVNVQTAVRLTHAMEDCFVAAQHSQTQFRQSDIDSLLHCVDLLQPLAKRSEGGTAKWHQHETAPPRPRIIRFLP